MMIKNKAFQSSRISRVMVMGVLALGIIESINAEILLAGPLKFDLQIIETKFLSEGVAIVDVDKDGVLDAMVGDYWYKGPNWARYEIRVSPGAYAITSYSDAMSVWAEDFNGDGYLDQLVMPFPGRPVKWYANPKGGTGHWTEYLVGFDYYNEQPQFLPIFVGDSKKYLLAGTKANRRFSAFRPGVDPTKPWVETPISPNNAPSVDIYYHGMGIGDINNDGRQDFIEPQGWYEQSPTKTWTYHGKTFNPTGEESGYMYAFDFNGDGLNDLLTSSSHGYGLWWFEQGAGNSWTKKEIDRSFSEVHAIHFEDMDNDGTPDIVTGKRKYAHNGGDAGGQDPSPLIWYKVTKGVNPKFEKYVIKADDAGIGTDFEIRDYNGDGWKDIGVSNKTGVKWYIQTGVPTASRLTLQRLHQRKVGRFVSADGRLMSSSPSNLAFIPKTTVAILLVAREK